MTQTTQNEHCTPFLDKLDAWLAGELDGHLQQRGMWEHHDSCESCRTQARLAREIGGILTALPELSGPEIRVPARKQLHDEHTLITRLLGMWRQPLVFVPALAALLVALVVVPQLRINATAVEPELVIIDGETYTRDEIRKATADLELALRYIDKYRPGRVISAELDHDDGEPGGQERSKQETDNAPTI